MKRKYDDEFRQNAVNKVLGGQLVRSVSQEIGVDESLIHKWKRTFSPNGNRRLSGAESSEIEALKKRNLELEQENKILKKTALIFGRGK